MLVDWQIDMVAGIIGSGTLNGAKGNEKRIFGIEMGKYDWGRPELMNRSLHMGINQRCCAYCIKGMGELTQDSVFQPFSTIRFTIAD